MANTRLNRNYQIPVFLLFFIFFQFIVFLYKNTNYFYIAGDALFLLNFSILFITWWKNNFLPAQLEWGKTFQKNTKILIFQSNKEKTFTATLDFYVTILKKFHKSICCCATSIFLFRFFLFYLFVAHPHTHAPF